MYLPNAWFYFLDFNLTSVLKEQEYCGYIISESGEQIWAKKCKNITETDSTGCMYKKVDLSTASTELVLYFQ